MFPPDRIISCQKNVRDTIKTVSLTWSYNRRIPFVEDSPLYEIHPSAYAYAYINIESHKLHKSKISCITQ